jgi:hypothetical protein
LFEHLVPQPLAAWSANGINTLDGRREKMLKKHLSLVLALLLSGAFVVSPAVAQSGRGRQIRIAELRKGGLNGVSNSAEIADVPAAPDTSGARMSANQSAGTQFDARVLNRDRRAPVVYSDNGGEHHPNKGDKIAGAVLLGFFVFEAWAISKSGF